MSPQRTVCSQTEIDYCENTRTSALDCHYCVIDKADGSAQCGSDTLPYAITTCSSDGGCSTDKPRCGIYNSETYCYEPGTCPKPPIDSSTTSSSSSISKSSTTTESSTSDTPSTMSTQSSTTTSVSISQRTACSSAEAQYCSSTSCTFCVIDIPENTPQCGTDSLPFQENSCTSDLDCARAGGAPKCGSYNGKSYCYTPGTCPIPPPPRTECSASETAACESTRSSALDCHYCGE